jgi:DNA-binding PadR family transcriptional regulator
MGRGPGSLSKLEFQVLLCLAEGPAHGYAIGRELKEKSEGRVDPTTGALYHILRRLEDSGLMVPAPEARSDSEDVRRQYFRITVAGRQVAADEAQDLKRLVEDARARRLLGADR